MLLRMPGAPEKPSSRARRTVVTLLLFAAGAALLVWQIYRLDLTGTDLREGFSKVGPWFAVVLLLALARFALRSYAWMTLTGRPIPLWAAIAATVSGDALGNATPLGLVASEPAKALYLRRHTDPAHALAALTAENFFYSVSVAIYVMLGAAAMLAFFDLDPAIHRAGVLAFAAMAAVLAGAAWLAWQQPAIASSVLARLPVGRLGTIVDRVRTFERDAYGAAGHQGRRLAVVTLCEAVFHALSFIECWLIFWLLTGVSSLLPALVFDGFNRVVNVLFKWVPMRLGVEEGGTALLAAAIGLPARSGFLLGLIRKLRVIVWVGVGFGLWVRARGRGRDGDAAR